MPTDVTIMADANEIARRKLTESQEAFIRSLQKTRGKSLDEVLPASIGVDDFNSRVAAVGVSLARVHAITEVLYPALGRLMQLARDREELWNAHFDSYDDFITWMGQEYGYKRSSLLEFRKLADRWGGTVDVQVLQTVGRTKMGLVSRVVDPGKEDSAKARKLLEYASTHSMDELADHLEKTGMHTGGRQNSKITTFVIRCSKKEQRQFAAWFSDARVQARTGTNKISEILEAMISECMNEWFIQGAQMIAAQDQRAAEAEVIVEA